MSLIDWRIGNTSKAQAPAAAPGSAPTTATAPLSSLPARPIAAAAPFPNMGQNPGPPGPPLPSGQAPRLDNSTPFFLGGVTAESSVMQANGNYTVVDVPVRTIGLNTSSNTNFGATVELAIAHRSGYKLSARLACGAVLGWQCRRSLNCACCKQRLPACTA